MIKRFLCFIGWHSFTYEPVGFDGCSVHARCRWCRGVGMVDSQGGLFSVRTDAERDPHARSLTTLDRDDSPVSPTCAHCGRLEADCWGTS
ncbi:hypothetical protein LCGC14_1369960 [marine sediment metagenome]|uniref:Uncharacterized protein n=1 Tax=marine sediment metagenome TaxID=412755 RepID=A0A0F9N7M4_9ZZZZ